MDPLVSIIIPTFNRAETLFRAVESCLNQFYSKIEVLIVDDGSSDETAYITKSFKDSRVRYFLHKNNLGVEAARNTGLRNATGEFVAFLDSDDEWIPNKISRQLDIFKSVDSAVGLVFTNGYSERVDRNIIIGNDLSGVKYTPGKNHFFPLRLSISPSSSWMLPKSITEEIGYFDEKMRNNYGDGDYFVRVAKKYPIYFLNENLVVWHASEKHLNVVSMNQIKNREYFLQKHFDLINKDKVYLFKLYRTLGKDLIALDRVKARRYLLRALRMKPYDLSILSKLSRTF